MGNTNLTSAMRAKNDEFYTQYGDIEKEINADLRTITYGAICAISEEWSDLRDLIGFGMIGKVNQRWIFALTRLAATNVRKGSGGCLKTTFARLAGERVKLHA